MAEKTKECKISVIQSPKNAISSVAYTLKVPNFFTLPQYDSTSFELDSPSFGFVKATWHFRFESQEQVETATGSLKKCSVQMIRLNFEEPQQRIFYEIVLLDANDKVCVDYGDACVFGADGEEQFLFAFDDDDPSYDRRDTLTMIVHLICVEVETDRVSGALSSLSDDLKDVLLNGQDHNLTFNVSDKNFRAHQDILRARSDVFRSMLTHDMLEKNSGVINVPDCDPQAFEQLLNYIYTGKVDSLGENIMFALYYAADKYNLAHLKEECCEFIKKSLNITNVCDALNLATKHSDTSLLNKAMNYFFSNVDDILLTVEWQLFMKENSTVANEFFIKSLKKIREAQSS